MIWLRVALKLHRCDFRAALAHGFGNAMHAIHDGAVGRYDYRKRQIRFVDQGYVLDDSAPSWGLVVAMPEDRGSTFGNSTAFARVVYARSGGRGVQRLPPNGARVRLTAPWSIRCYGTPPARDRPAA